MIGTKAYLFLLIVGVLSSVSFLSNYLLVSENLYFNSLAEQLTYEQIEGIIQKIKEWKWVGYAIIPLLVLLKLTLVASCLSIGMFFVDNQFRFSQLFDVALKAEFIFLMPPLLKILWFLFVQTDYSLQDLQYFYPLSALNLFDYKTLDPWLVYPLQLLNVFEIMYWVVLARGISQLVEADHPTVQPIHFNQSFGLVASSYGLGLLLWVALMMFISVSYA